MSKNDKLSTGNTPDTTSVDGTQGTDVVQQLQAQVDALKADKEQLEAQVTLLSNELVALRKKPQANDAEKRGIHIRVASMSDGYFRSGVQFARQPRELALADLSKEQIAAIRADARLVVVDL